jgi:hypothetical protein
MFPVLVVVSFNVPEPEDVPKIIEALNPPSLPMFAGNVRIVVGTDVAEVVQFLDKDNIWIRNSANKKGRRK